MDDVWGVVLAGGLGRRLWPWSTSQRPKPALPIGGEDPLLRRTLERLPVPWERVLVVTSDEVCASLQAVLPELSAGQWLVEPSGRNTAPAIALAAEEVARRGGRRMAVFPADHHIGDVAAFRETISIALEVAQGGALVLLGQQPTEPSTAYGYLSLGEVLGRCRGAAVRRVQRFVEKPSREHAMRLLDGGDVLWNGGMFVWTVAAIRAALEATLPDTAAAMSAWSAGAALESVWFDTDPISIDHGVLERWENVVALSCDFDWRDLGTWASVAAVLPQGPLGRQLVDQALSSESEQNVVVAPGKTVGLAGVSGLVVVAVDDTVVVADAAKTAVFSDWSRRLEVSLPQPEGRMSAGWANERSGRPAGARMPRALITGITGQDGSYLADLLLERGYEVFGLVRRTSDSTHPRIQHLEGRVTLLEGDLLDLGSLIRAVQTARPDHVYNLAAQSFVGRSWKEPVHTAEVTGLGALRVLEAVRLTQCGARVYQASTSEMYGNALEAETLSSAGPFRPRSPYGTAKLFAHRTAINYRESYDMFVATGILFNHESPRRGAEFVTRKVCIGAARAAAGDRSKLGLGNLDARRDWGWAPDYVDAMWRMLSHDTPLDLMVATGVSHSVRDLCAAAYGSVGLQWQDYVEVDPAFFRPAELHVLKGDPSEAERTLGWRPTVSFEEMIRRMVAAEQARLR